MSNENNVYNDVLIVMVILKKSPPLCMVDVLFNGDTTTSAELTLLGLFFEYLGPSFLEPYPP